MFCLRFVVRAFSHIKKSPTRVAFIHTKIVYVCWHTISNLRIQLERVKCRKIWLWYISFEKIESIRMKVSFDSGAFYAYATLKACIVWWESFSLSCTHRVWFFWSETYAYHVYRNASIQRKYAFFVYFVFFLFLFSCVFLIPFYIHPHVFSLV